MFTKDKDKKKKYFIGLLWLMFFSLIFLVLLNNSFSYLDPDLGWHLKCGQEILQNKAVPSIEHYDYTIEGSRWVDHEWLSNLITYIIYAKLGYIWVNVFFALIIVLALAILIKNSFKYFKFGSSAVFFTMVFTLWGLMGCIGHFGVRMQEFSVLFFVLLISVIFKFDKERNYKTLFWLLPLFYLASCLHPGFLIGFALLFFWLGVRMAENILYKKKPELLIKHERNLEKKDAFIFVGFSLLSIIVTLFTPYGLELYSFLYSYASSYYMSNIQEWLSPLSPSAQLFKISYLLIILFLIAIINSRGFLRRLSYYKIDLWLFLSCVIFFFMSIKSARHFPLFFAISLPLFLEIFSSYFSFPAFWGIFRSKIFGIATIVWISATYLLIIFSLILSMRPVREPFKEFCSGYPCSAIQFLKDNDKYDSLNIFNNYDWGGFMIWEMPERKLFIDGRLPQYPYKGHSFLEEYRDFEKEGLAPEKLKEHDIGIVLLKKDPYLKLNFFDKYVMGYNEGKLNESRKDLLREYLGGSSEWSKAYEDEKAIIFVKK